jgi:hypothetical protein
MAVYKCCGIDFGVSCTSCHPFQIKCRMAVC